MSAKVYVEHRGSVPEAVRGRHHVTTAEGTELFQAGSLMEAVRLARAAGYTVLVPVTRSRQDRQNPEDWFEWK